MNTLNAGGGSKSASALSQTKNPIETRMFYFEEPPHDDGTSVHEAVQSIIGEIVDVAMPPMFKGRGFENVRMEIVQAYPAFFIGRRVRGGMRGQVVSVRYSDITDGTCTSDKISDAVSRVEASRNRTKNRAGRAKRANSVVNLID